MYIKAVVLVLLLVLSGSAAAAEPEMVDSDDAFSQIVGFVVSRDPVLAAQENVMAAARELDQVKATDAASVPSYAQSSLLEIRLESASGIQRAEQTYAELRRSLVSSLLANLAQIFTLRNEIEHSRDLYRMLEERYEPTERQVTAGIIREDVLWELSERMMTTRISIDEAKNQLRTLERETAINYGGEDWSELLTMIRDLR